MPSRWEIWTSSTLPALGFLENFSTVHGPRFGTLSTSSKSKGTFTLPKTNSSHLKINDQNMIVSFWGPAYFLVRLLLVSGRVLFQKDSHPRKLTWKVCGFVFPSFLFLSGHFRVPCLFSGGQSKRFQLWKNAVFYIHSINSWSVISSRMKEKSEVGNVQNK